MSALLSLIAISVALRHRNVPGVSLEVAEGDIIALLGSNGGQNQFAARGLGFHPAVVRFGIFARTTRTEFLRVNALCASPICRERPQSIWPISVENLVALGRFAYGAAPTGSFADKTAVDEALPRAC